MKASWEKIEKNVGVLDIEVEAEQVAAALDKAFKKVVQKVNVPGFRKGKVPRAIFESKFGVESLYQDALDFIVPDAYVAAVNETGIEPVDRPEVDVEQFAKGQTLKFKAKVVVKPEVELGEYKGLELESVSSEVSAEEVQEELQKMQNRHAELVPVEEGAAQNGDVVVIDFEGFVDGVAFEGGKAERYSLELGSGSFIPGFEEQVVGLEKGGEKDITVTFPENYHSEELKGKEAVFKIVLHDIKRKNLPELDDEFAKDVSEFETLDEYKADLQKKLQERKENEVKSKKEADAVEKVAASATVDIPEVMINDETEQMLKEFENRLRTQGMNIDMYYQFTGQSAEDLKGQMRGDAEKRVRNNLVLEAVAKKEGIEVTEEEINAEFENLAGMYGRSAAEIRSIFTSNGNLSTLLADIITRKTVAFLVDNSKSA
ncbi:Tig [Paenibacillus mucilaginosus 3016]|uniref:Trigger factor n=1 Tax=Paenibacillus mucilaginosus 3016 TaxID=1116391 RepID=H6NR49_9BACL|nr:trigger factor [Paenibacillus mucilaginosus]AFC32742.1 Tig [Paenibacillus mucilaginosus 3016]WFA21206.1 trigger factor [Paenibacillus mucilaginosus]